MMKRFLLLLSLIALLACQKENSEQNPPMNAGQPPMPMTASNTSTAPSDQVRTITGLQTPESVYYDKDQDVYFVSNINGKPLDADNNGFIDRVEPDSLKVTKWIESGKNGVTLNAPKGMAEAGDVLYVTDITTVRKFNRKTGAPEGEIPIPGSTFLNDAASDGKDVYISDSGLKAGSGGNFEGTGTDAIWKISGDKPVKIASGKDLDRPNGVEVVDGKVYVVSFGSNELYQIDNGKKANVRNLPKGSLDGLVHLDDGTFLVSSWEGKAVYSLPPATAQKENPNHVALAKAVAKFKAHKDNPTQVPISATTLVSNVDSPADIGYDAKRRRLLVPHFMENVVTVHPIRQ